MKPNVAVSLNQFQVIDDGRKYLKVYHPGIYGRAEAIGAIEKAQLAESSLEDILKRAVLDELSDQYEVTFTDSFIAPSVEALPVEKSSKCAACQRPLESGQFCQAHSWIAEEPSSKEAAPEDLNLKYKRADATRQFTDFQKEKDLRASQKLEAFLTNESVAYLHSLHLDSPRITSIKSVEGGFEVTASVVARKGPVHITFLTKSAEEKFEFPSAEDTAKLVEQAVPLTQETFQQAQKEAFAKMAEVEERENLFTKQTEAAFKSPLKKEASLSKEAEGSNTPQQLNYHPILRLSKELFPESMEVGDVIYTEGAYYKLTSKTENQLSKGEADAYYWVFTCVSPEENPKPVHEVRNY